MGSIRLARIGNEGGQTLTEVVLVLVVSIAILGALAPTISATVRRAEDTAATSAMTAIGNQINTFLTEAGQTNFTIDGTVGGTIVNLLVGDGDTPLDVSASGSATWQTAVNNATGLVDFLERHMVTNNPRGNAANAYSTVDATPWRGAYLTAPIDPDPWGNRYMANVQYLGASANDVVVYSAGADEEIDTLFTANPVVAGDDDRIFLVQP